MPILTDLRNRVQIVNDGLQSGEIVRNVVVQHPDDIMELQRIQLLQGKSASGEDIRPFYSEDLKPDGYFYSVESAGRYAAWKQDLEYPYTVSRNPDAPNLYITGKFHSEIGVEFGPDAVGIVGETPFAAGIMLKYGIETFGLMMSNWLALFEEFGAYDELMQNVKQLLYVY